jgi:hypothetical protein
VLKSQRRESGAKNVPEVVEAVADRTFAEAHPEWKRRSDRVNELCRRRDAIHDELRDIEQATAKENAVIFHDRAGVEIQIPPRPKPTLGGRVKALLGEFEPPEPPPEPKEIVRTYSDPFMARKVELTKELVDIETALEILHPQLAQAHQQASLAFCQASMAAYRDRAARICHALVELGAACVEHHQYIEGIRAQGCDPAYFRPVDASRFLGDPRYGMPMLREFLDWAAELGHFDQAEVEATALPAPPVATAYTPPPAPPTPHTDAVMAKLRRMLPSRRGVVFQP